MDKLEHKLKSIQNKLGGTEPTPDVIDKLGWHLDYIEELLATSNTPTQWYGTQAEYDALGTYDSNTIYNIIEE